MGGVLFSSGLDTAWTGVRRAAVSLAVIRTLACWPIVAILYTRREGGRGGDSRSIITLLVTFSLQARTLSLSTKDYLNSACQGVHMEVPNNAHQMPELGQTHTRGKL